MLILYGLLVLYAFEVVLPLFVLAIAVRNAARPAGLERVI
jgi:hypothetical protein